MQIGKKNEPTTTPSGSKETAQNTKTPKHIKHSSLLQDKGRQRIDPNNFAIMAVSNKPLDDGLIQQITAAYQIFVENLKAGTATDQMFYQACENHYLYINFCEVLLAASVNADLNVELLFKTELSIPVAHLGESHFQSINISSQVFVM